MSSWQTLYEEPTQLTSHWGHHRIFAPESYPSLRAATTVPIIVHEAMLVARNFPICWQKEGDRLRLVALVSAFPGALRVPPFPELPLVFQAYPIMARGDSSRSAGDIWVDRAIPDKPTDIGAPLLMDDHKMSNATRLRVEAASQFDENLGHADDLTDDLMARSLLEPWPLSFDLGNGQRLERHDLMVFSARQLGNPAMFSLIERLGVVVGLFLGLHRASLFRINWLLSHARTHIRTASAPIRAEEIF